MENFKKRLKALEAKVFSDGIVLNDVQLAALEKAKNKREATGEIKTMHPGYLGSLGSAGERITSSPTFLKVFSGLSY